VVALQHVFDATIEPFDHAVGFGDLGGVSRCSIPRVEHSVSSSCCPVATRFRRPKRRSVNSFPLSHEIFFNSFPLETDFFFAVFEDYLVLTNEKIKHHQRQRNRSSLSIHWHPMRFLVTVPNPYPLSQRFQIRDCRLRVLSFCL
jgi:hypothetical protein